MKRIVLYILFTGLLLAQTSYQQKITPLVEGNARYMKGLQKVRDYAGQREQQRKGQTPYAIIVTCADSRLSPEIIFDEDLGKLFVIRVAGNVVSPEVLGSIEYAAEHLHVDLLVILGHSSCGAVAATIAGGDNGVNINSLTDRIKPAVAIAQGKTKNKNLLLPLAIESNVDLQLHNAIVGSKILQELIEEKKLTLAGAVYSIETGEVVLYPSENEGTSHSPGKKEEHAKPKKNEPAGEPKKNEHSTEPKKENKDHGAEKSRAGYKAGKEKQVKNNIFSDGELYCIQLSSWKNKEKADKEKERAAKSKHKAFVADFKDPQGEVWYRVRVGYFSSLIEAQLYMKEQDLTAFFN